MVSAMTSNKNLKRMTWLGCGLAMLLLPLALAASNLNLATVPERRTVQLTIYNSEDLTLVRESRVLSFKQGVNPLQFSWANTLIDPTSVELTFREPGSGLEVLDTTFPHDRPQTLFWNVQSDADREAVIEISYFTSGITWEADYLAIAAPDEQTLRLESFVRVRNQSGEDYENAQVRLVVGTINLVEKIAELARLPVGRVGELRSEEYQDLRQKAARRMMAPAPSAPAMMLESAIAADMAAPKEIIKEGLSEYFIYTIEGTETVPQRLGQTLAQLRGGRSADDRRVPLPAARVRRPTGAALPAAQ
jgi:hypothetical protein